MARAAFADILARGRAYALAILASGKNPDTTDYSLAVSAVASSAANTPAIATGATALAANSSRKQWSIQNVGTNPLFVKLGSGASSSVFHFILKGGTADSDGLGGMLSDDKWTGIVSIAGTSPKYVVSELT